MRTLQLIALGLVMLLLVAGAKLYVKSHPTPTAESLHANVLIAIDGADMSPEELEAFVEQYRQQLEESESNLDKESDDKAVPEAN